MVLATLEDRVAPFFGDCMADHSAEWLEAAIDAGAFALTSEMNGRFQPTGHTAVYPMVLAISECIRRAVSPKQTSDPLLGPMQPAHNVVNLAPDPDFKAAFEMAVEYFVRDHERALERAGRPFTGVFMVEVNYMMAALMATACALDARDALAMLLEAAPHAATATVEFGQQALQASNVLSYVQLTPYGWALQFSRVECMKLIEAAFEGDVIELGKPATENRLFDALTMHERFTPACWPHAYAHAMRVAMAACSDPEAHASLDQHAHTVLSVEDRSTGLASYVPAYIAVGLYDAYPTHAFDVACAGGHPEVLRHVADKVVWARSAFSCDPTHNPLIGALNAFKEGSIAKDEFERSMLFVIDKAIADGQADVVLKQSLIPEHDDEYLGGCGPIAPQPLGLVIEEGLGEVLLRMLQHGLDPNAPVAPGAWTPVQIADELNPSMATVLRSYNSRQQVMTLLGEPALSHTTFATK
ncbi:hypothetical protein [Variovorax sp. LT1P1]|uniref:hypothetical protein n=1 Tax=Variovorax sp. LT1P1 TaxID=3443730 RepID=UPI003F498E22